MVFTNIIIGYRSKRQKKIWEARGQYTGHWFVKTNNPAPITLWKIFLQFFQNPATAALWKRTLPLKIRLHMKKQRFNPCLSLCQPRFHLSCSAIMCHVNTMDQLPNLEYKPAIQRSDCGFERRKTFAVEMNALARSSDIQRSFLSVFSQHYRWIPIICIPQLELMVYYLAMKCHLYLCFQ